MIKFKLDDIIIKESYFIEGTFTQYTPNWKITLVYFKHYSGCSIRDDHWIILIDFDKEHEYILIKDAREKYPQYFL